MQIIYPQIDFDSINLAYYCIRNNNSNVLLEEKQNLLHMTEHNSSQPAQKPLYTINNPESVIEVFLDEAKGEVREVKCLNYNRCKEYVYAIDEYLERYSHHPAGKAVAAYLEVSQA